MGLWSNEKTKLVQEAAEFRARVDELERSFKALDEQFNKWKEGVLKFEHSQLGIDDGPGNDDWVCDREFVRTGEDENDIQQPSEQIDRELEDCRRIYEERGKQDE